ncbi:MAG: hypothetical protein IJJ23_03615 [Clostridia bacterium]|nr:hypothetical protein [Clostridia bacterium]
MKTLIAIPAMSWVYTGFLQSMLELDKPNAGMAIQQNSMIFDARNNLAWGAMNNGFDRVLWIDSDMRFDADLLTRMNADMDEHGLEYVSAWFTGRKTGAKACVYKSIKWNVEQGKVTAKAEPFEKRMDGLFETAGSGFGAVLMKTDVIRAVSEKYGPPFIPLPYMGEDISFCWRAGQLGIKMWCDGSIRVGHIGPQVFGED